MGRKRNTAIDDLLTLFSKLPWWAGVACAVAAWFGFAHLAASFAGSQRPHHIVFATFAGLARWGVPLVCLVGALMSVLGRRKRAALLGSASSGGGADAIAAMSWSDFELLIGESFRRRGYTVKEAGGRAPDGGVDLIVRRDGQTTLVQCKHWKAQRVGVPVVREVFGVMTAESATESWVVTSGRFTDEARAFAGGKPIRLVDGLELAALLREGRDARAKSAATAQRAATQEKKPEPAATASTPAAPACPRCGDTMVRRTASRGANAGQWFWGCGGFPRCRGTRDPG